MSSNSTDPSQPSPISSRERIVWIWPVAVLAVILLIAFAVLIFRGVSDRQETTTDEPQISLTGSGPQPATITVKKGQNVRWTNEDQRDHKLAGDQPEISSLDSEEPLHSGESYVYTFEKTGTYTYHDPTNPLTIKGVVIVE